MKTIDLGSYRKTGIRFFDSEPFTICFVYTPDGERCVIKGMREEVQEYLDTHFPVCLYHCTYWHKGRSRGSWRVNGRKVYIFYRKEEDPNTGMYISDSRRKYRITYVDKNGECHVDALVLRRMSHKWLDIYDKAAQSERFV